jgi:Na+-translocating ferredoxin:NAD+ oxidoreductase subunit D
MALKEAGDRLMSFELIQKHGPHLKGGMSDQAMMWSVVIALLPATLAAVYFFSWPVLILLVVCISSAMLTESLLGKLRNGPSTLKNGSALLTGLLLGLILPVSLPLWMCALGSMIAIGLGKVVFGGLGMNVFNPALVGRAFLQAAFPVAMTTWLPTRLSPAIDAVSTATPLAAVKFRGIEESIFDAMPPLWDLFLGNTAGSLGETSALAILLGGLALCFMKVVNWRIPLSMCLGTVLLGGLLFILEPTAYPHPLFHLLSGGLLFGAFFMASDLVTSPMTGKGMWIFGLGIGFLSVLIRVFGGLPEGVMYSILLMNAGVPLIDRVTRPRLFGRVKEESA